MARTPSGTIHSVATELGAPVTVTGINNAKDAVAAVEAGHGIKAGDFVILYSGWSGANYRPARVKAADEASITLEGIDTSNLNRYAAGGGAGELRKVVKFMELDRTLNHSSSGGEDKDVTVKFLESDQEIVLSDGRTAIKRTFEMDADMIGKPFYEALKELADSDADTIVQRRAKSGAISLLAAKVSFSEEESLQEGQAVTVSGSFKAQNKSTRYAA